MKSRYLFLMTFLSVIFLREEKFILSMILILITFLLLYKKPKNYLYVFLFGFIIGPLVESSFILSGAWSYDPKDILFLNFAFYLPFVWGIAGLCMVNFYNKLIDKNK